MAEGCLPPLNALIDTCHSLGIPVIYTQHGHLDPEAEEASSVLVRWWGAGGSIRCALAPAAARREQAQQIPAYRCAALCAQPLSPPPLPQVWLSCLAAAARAAAAPRAGCSDHLQAHIRCVSGHRPAAAAAAPGLRHSHCGRRHDQPVLRDHRAVGGPWQAFAFFFAFFFAAALLWLGAPGCTAVAGPRSPCCCQQCLCSAPLQPQPRL